MLLKVDHLAFRESEDKSETLTRTIATIDGRHANSSQVSNLRPPCWLMNNDVMHMYGCHGFEIP